MHYHIMWGLVTAEKPSILTFTDGEKAIGRFVDIIKTTEGGDRPPPMEEKVFNENTRAFRVTSATHKYILVFCSNTGCDAEIEEELHPVTLN